MIPAHYLEDYSMMKDQGGDMSDDSTNGNFLPYTYNDLDEALSQCNVTAPWETEAKRAKSLQELRNILKAEKDLKYNDNENFLLCFLRSRKYEVAKAASAIKHYYHFLGVHNKLVETVTQKEVITFLNANIMGFLPYRNARGCAIMYIRAEAWNPDELPTDDAICGGLVALKGAVMANHLNQVSGLVAILDLKSFTLKQLFSISKYLLFFTRALQKCCPCRVQRVHVVNIPYIFSLSWNLVRPVISEKVKKRITFHDSDVKSLHKYIPPDILPSELQGETGPFNNEDWSPDPEWMLNTHIEDFKYGYSTLREEADLDKMYEDWKKDVEEYA